VVRIGLADVELLSVALAKVYMKLHKALLLAYMPLANEIVIKGSDSFGLLSRFQ
jgi:hypothetical protein